MNHKFMLIVVFECVFVFFSIGWTQINETEPNNFNGQAGIKTIDQKGVVCNGMVDGPGDQDDLWYIPTGSSGSCTINIQESMTEAAYSLSWYSTNYGDGAIGSTSLSVGDNSVTLNSNYFYSIIVHSLKYHSDFDTLPTIYGITLSGDASLPVALSTFSAMQRGRAVNLNWRTESEINNAGFIIQRQFDSAWTTIASYKNNLGLRGQGNQYSATDYSYTDSDVVTGQYYIYRLLEVGVDGTVTALDTISITLCKMPVSTQLLPAHPNPFNPVTKVQYHLEKDSTVVLKIIDLTGRHVRTLVGNEMQLVGSHSMYWNGKNDSGNQVPSGMYFLILHTGGELQRQGVTLVR